MRSSREDTERRHPALADLPPEIIMPVDDLVDAALAGLDRGETITIPSLPDVAHWEAYEAARLKLSENVSRDRPAACYRVAQAA